MHANPLLSETAGVTISVTPAVCLCEPVFSSKAPFSRSLLRGRGYLRLFPFLFGVGEHPGHDHDQAHHDDCAEDEVERAASETGQQTEYQRDHGEHDKQNQGKNSEFFDIHNNLLFSFSNITFFFKIFSNSTSSSTTRISTC